MMGIIDDLIAKGRLKITVLNDDMVRKELYVGKKDYDYALASYDSGNYKWATIQAWNY